MRLDVLSIYCLTMATAMLLQTRTRAQDPLPEESVAAVTIESAMAWARPRREEEGWRFVPWRRSLVAALDEARESKKPVFYYGCDGIIESGSC